MTKEAFAALSIFQTNSGADHFQTRFCKAATVLWKFHILLRTVFISGDEDERKVSNRWQQCL